MLQTSSTLDLYCMGTLVNVVKFHIGNVINRPPRQKAPMDRVLTSLIFKGIDWGFGKNPRCGAAGSLVT